MPVSPHQKPTRGLSAVAAASVAVGMVVGAGLFKSPATVAANVDTDALLFAAWALGGAVSLIGALCYAELAAAFPSRGGDYHFLTLAYGRWVGFLFAWARFAVINTGALALLGFVLGDYLNAALPLGPYGPALYAAAAVLLLSMLNLSDRRAGVDAQLGFTSLLVIGVLAVSAVGLWIAYQDLPAASVSVPASATATPAFGVAMVFVLLAYGGWTEVATLSSEVADRTHGMLKAMVLSMALVTVLYLLVNWALWRGLGLEGLAASQAPAADLLARAFGPAAQIPIILVVAAAVITSLNATILVGGRTTYAVTKEWPGLHVIGKWDASHSVPRRAIIAQAVVALCLIAFGAATREGFVTMVDYTAPVFWLFIGLSGVAVIILRRRQPDTPRPFKVPLYPWLPLLFVASSAYVVWSSVAYVKVGAVAGVGVLALGLGLAVVLNRVGKKVDHVLHADEPQ